MPQYTTTNKKEAIYLYYNKLYLAEVNSTKAKNNRRLVSFCFDHDMSDEEIEKMCKDFRQGYASVEPNLFMEAQRAVDDEFYHEINKYK